MENPCRTFFVGATLLLIFTGIATAYTALQIQLECNRCDVQATGAIATYGTEYGTFNTALDGARYHCRRFQQAISCYTDCLHDTGYTYTSDTKEVILLLYALACDPSCYATVLPYCYISTVGSNDPLKSCTGSHINQNLDRCLQRELFANQNCSSVCSKAQRFNSINYFGTILLCKIPYDAATECFTWAAYCNEKIFGASAVDYILYSNRTLIGSNRLACRHFVDDYDTCLQKAVSGNVVIGTYPYTVTYSMPCAGFANELRALVDYVRDELVGPLCKNPSATLNDTCPGTTVSNTGAQRLLTDAATLRYQSPDALRPTTLAAAAAILRDRNPDTLRPTTTQDPKQPRHIPVINRAASSLSVSHGIAVAALFMQATTAVWLALFLLI